MPPFRAWLKTSKDSRTCLVMGFKVLALDEYGNLDLPTNCHYPDDEQARSKELAVMVLRSMIDQNFPVCSILVKLAGRDGTDLERAKARERSEEAREEFKKTGAGKGARPSSSQQQQCESEAEESCISGPEM
eukprot:6195345-Pleurochrysis_carterae.AAC.2